MIEDVKVYAHWNKNNDGSIVYEFILPNESRFGFIFCNDEPGGWWFISKKDGEMVAHDEEFPKEYLNELKLVINR
jgi:hypothetical protein